MKCSVLKNQPDGAPNLVKCRRQRTDNAKFPACWSLYVHGDLLLPISPVRGLFLYRSPWLYRLQAKIIIFELKHKFPISQISDQNCLKLFGVRCDLYSRVKGHVLRTQTLKSNKYLNLNHGSLKIPIISNYIIMGILLSISQ